MLTRFSSGINTKQGRDNLEKLMSQPLVDHLFAVKDYRNFGILVDTLRETIQNTNNLPCNPYDD